MRVLGVRFGHADDARRALAELRQRLDLGENDASVGPLGSTSYEEPRRGAGDAALLAGRFWSERVPIVSQVVSHHGGEVVIDEDERWIR